MMHFNHKCGFALQEVLVSIVLIGIILTPLLIVQASTLRAIFNVSGRMHRIILAKQFWYESSNQIVEGKKVQEKTIDDPQTLLVYTQKEPAKNSALASVQGLMIQKVTVQWTDQQRSLQDTIIQLKYKLPQKSTGS